MKRKGDYELEEEKRGKRKNGKKLDRRENNKQERGKIIKSK